MIKMNWGHKLLIVILLFLAGMIGIVIYASQQDNEMIDDHYYEKELVYQQVIDAQRNLLSATQGHHIITLDSHSIAVQLPVGTFEQMKDGWIELLHHAQASEDYRIAMTPDPRGDVRIQLSTLASGVYKMRVRWTNAGVPYYLEEQIKIRA